MESELIVIGSFALFGCIFFLLFLLCFHRALRGRDDNNCSDEDDHPLHHIININPSSIMALHSSSFFNVKRLSRSFTAERSALIMPTIVREFNLEEIETVTNKFSGSNLIREGHSGEIYRGIVDGEEAVVVKRFHPINHLMSTEPADCDKDFYLAEMDVYGKVQDQRFLVPVLGQCLENEDKFLVYEYMTYGDLETILSSSTIQNSLMHKLVQSSSTADIARAREGSPPSGGDGNQLENSDIDNEMNMPTIQLTWPMRMRIARGVAKALVYLHHMNRPALSHRNIQASSILLNKDFDVKLGSLSDAQKLDSGELPAYDIYCFGKLLLDLISGLNISGNCRSEDAQSWTQKCFGAITSTTLFSIKEHLLQIVDASLVPSEDQILEIIEVAKLAKLCMEPTSLQKLTMKRVLEMLPVDSS